jgi:predicted transcriptional regulator
MARPKTKTRMEVRVNAELLAVIDELAEKTGRTRTDVVEEGLRYMESRLRSQAARLAQNEANKDQ